MTGGFSGAARRQPPAGPFARGAVGRVVELTAGARVLDVDAGTGLLTGPLHRARRAVVAVDPDPDAAAQVRRAVPVPVVVARADALPFRPGAFDAVVSGRAARPLGRDDAWWAAVTEVVRPGGRVVLLGEVPPASEESAAVEVHEDGPTVTAVSVHELP